MAIQKKSLISTLKTTKKANVAKEEFAPATNEGAATRKVKVQKSLIIKKSAMKRAEFNRMSRTRGLE
jgi:hypothetical protein